MNGHYRLRAKARADLVKIYKFTARRWGRDQAAFYLNQLDERMDFIATQPLSGRPCPELRVGYYKYPSGAHFIFYRIVDEGIDIVRILHERMNFRGHI